MKTCEFCKKEFKENFKTQRFCSLKCSSSRGLRPRKGKIKKCIICNKEFYTKQSDLSKSCSKKCANIIIGLKNKGKKRTIETRKKMSEHAKTRTGNKNPCWRGGKIGGNGKYVYIYSPKHPNIKPYSVYYPEHKLIVEKLLNRYLSADETVHHINGIKDDNRLKNLYLFKTKKQHNSYHTLNSNYSKKNKHKIKTIKKSNLPL